MRLRSLLLLLVPGAPLLLAAVLLVHRGPPIDTWPPYLPVAWYALLVAGLLLSWRFNRSRMVFALVLLAMADRILRAVPDPRALSALALLLPVNLALVALARERGILTVWGLSRLAFLLAQPLAVAAILRYQTPGTILPWERSILTLPAQTTLPLPQAALLAFAAAFLVMAYRWLRRRGRIVAGLIWTLGAALLGLLAAPAGLLTRFYFAAGALIILVAMVEESFRLAFHDELTGLPGRRALDEALLRLGGSYVLAMADVDHFKKFNDKHGHDAGDQVLRMVAGRLARAGGGGKAFRYGGEEFTLVYPNRTREEVLPFLEELLESIRGEPFHIRSRTRPRKKPRNPRAVRKVRKKVTVTVSIGVAERSDRYPTPEDVIQAADKALYRAKRDGRDRVNK